MFLAGSCLPDKREIRAPMYGGAGGAASSGSGSANRDATCRFQYIPSRSNRWHLARDAAALCCKEEGEGVRFIFGA
jgi:hypothetical protein